MPDDLTISGSILMIDDEQPLLHGFEIALRNEGYEHILCCNDAREVESLIEKQKPDVVLLDLNMPYIHGDKLLPILTARLPGVPVLVITARQDVESAVSCMKNGAFDYLIKPIEKDRLVRSVQTALEVRELRRENSELRQSLVSPTLRHPEAFASIYTRDENMLAIFRYVEAVAATAQPVLITGETGAGKELIAQAIHQLSGRSGRFVSLNVAGLDDQMFADTFFGHVRGAFTGAIESRSGLVEAAENGTLFLDEIGDLSLTSQVKLLRLLQECEYIPLGTDAAKRSNARIIVATNRHLHNLMDMGNFREDLYFRLLAHYVRIPPLRERLGDLPLLVSKFVAEAAKELKKNAPAVPRELISHLSAYPFPGNVRELKAMIHNAVTSNTSSTLSIAPVLQHMSFQSSSRKSFEHSADSSGSLRNMSPLPTARNALFMLVSEALRRTHNNQNAAAKLLDITRQTVNKYASQIRRKRVNISDKNV